MGKNSVGFSMFLPHSFKLREPYPLPSTVAELQNLGWKRIVSAGEPTVSPIAGKEPPSPFQSASGLTKM